MRKNIAISLVLLLVLALAQEIPKYTVNAQLCIGCRQCVVVCPVGAITIIKGKAVIDVDKCTGCGKCAQTCPTKAISQIAIAPEIPNSAKTEEPYNSTQTSADTSSTKATTPAQTGAKETTNDKTITPSPAESSHTPAMPDTSKKVEQPKESPEAKSIAIVISEKCIGCTLCQKVCPTSAIQIVDGKAVIDPEKCTGCGKCVSVCPVKAIEMR